jgi:hypothetical protein
MDLRKMIVEWVMQNDFNGEWTARLWVHLMQRGAPPDDAVLAIEQFVNEVILAAKNRTSRPAPASPPGGAGT